MRGTIITAAACALAGAVCGWLAKPTAENAVEASAVRAEKPADPISDAGEAASLAALRARVKELEAALAVARDVPAAEPAPTNAVARGPEDGPGGRRPFDPAKHFEEMRKNDPARYAQITNRMAQFRARQLTRMENRLETLAAVDTSGWSEAARKMHETYQELLVKREELFESMRPEAAGELTDEQRRANWEEMRTLGQEIARTAQAEREQLLRDTARGYGLSGKDAAAFAETAKAVIEATDESWGRGPGGGGPPPGGPRPR